MGEARDFKFGVRTDLQTRKMHK